MIYQSIIESYGKSIITLLSKTSGNVKSKINGDMLLSFSHRAKDFIRHKKLKNEVNDSVVFIVSNFSTFSIIYFLKLMVYIIIKFTLQLLYYYCTDYWIRLFKKYYTAYYKVYCDKFLKERFRHVLHGFFLWEKVTKEHLRIWFSEQ